MIAPSKNTNLGFFKIFSFLSVFMIVILINGAVPFISLPTQWQMLWTSGFAQSFLNQGWPTIYAAHFGLPQPAPIAFGLAGAFMQSTLMAFLHLSAAPAYSLMLDIYLAIAFWGAFKFSRLLGLHYGWALLMALVWLSIPIIWGHSPYSMLSLGLALIPFYLWVAQWIFDIEGVSKKDFLLRIMAFLAVCILAIFMDGYSYVMFICGSFILFFVKWLLSSHKAKLFFISVPVLLGGIVLSWWLFTIFMGQKNFDTTTLNFFRGYGIDLLMLFIPTRGVHWLWDMIGFGVDRSVRDYYGDPSVWITTFSAIIILLGSIGFCVSRDRTFRYSLLLIALFGTYMSLGPSLKFHSLRPDKPSSEQGLRSSMSKEFAIGSTGSGILSEKLPGFKNMRASYRWLALGLFGFWGLFALLVVKLQKKDRNKFALFLILVAIVSNLPQRETGGSIHYLSSKFLKSYRQLHKDLSLPLSQQIEPDTWVVFALPYESKTPNDFVVTYLAPNANFKTYNIGGDKNVKMAQQNWPSSIKNLLKVDSKNALPYVQEVLLTDTVNYVIIPFFDSLYDADMWPPAQEKVELAKKGYAKVITALKSDPDFQVNVYPYYAIISLKPNIDPKHIALRLKSFSDKLMHLSLNKKVVIGNIENKLKTSLGENWYDIAQTGVWSKDHATLALHVDPKCQKTACALNLNFQVFYAYPERPSVVDFYSGKRGTKLHSVTLYNENNTSVIIPFNEEDLTPDGKLELKFDVSNAVSGKQIGVNEDSRVMGMGLIDMSLEEARS